MTQTSAPPAIRRRPSRRLALVLVAVFVAVALAATTFTVITLVGSGGYSSPAADPDTRFAVSPAPIAVGTNPGDVEAGAGSVWVSGTDDGTLTRIDPDTGTTTRIDVGGQPGQIVVAEDAVWVRNLGDRITRVDVATGAVSPPIPGGDGQVSGMTVGGGYVWLSHRQDGTVTRVDTRTLAVVGAPTVVGTGPAAIEFGTDAAYVLNTDEGTVSRLDAGTGTVSGTARVGESLGGIEVDQEVVYVAADGGVVPVPESTFTLGESYAFEGWTYFEVNGGVMWVIYDEDPRVQRFDAATRRPLGAAVPDAGSDVGRARYAYDRLWITAPGQNAVVTVAPQ